jgi:hypothetical protein
MTEFQYVILRIVPHDGEQLVGVWTDIKTLITKFENDSGRHDLMVYMAEPNTDYRAKLFPMYWWYDEFIQTPLAQESMAYVS